MKVRSLLPGLCALVLCLGCDDDSPTGGEARPTLRVGGGGECGVTLPIPTAAEFGSRTYRTAAVTVSGTDPGASNMEIRNGTEVTLLQTSGNPDTQQVVAFVSGFDGAIAGGAAPGAALQQAAQSDGVTFVGGGAVDRVFCVSGGTATIEASIASYAGGGGYVGPVTTPQNLRFQIRCVSAEVYEQQCGNPPPPDAAPVVDMGVDGGSDGGVDADLTDGGPSGPSLWNIQFVPPENPDDLRVGIRNSGLGRRDNTELTFRVAELDVPLTGVLVKFFLDEITQPGVTISGGNASLFEEDNEVVVETGGDGLARVRLVAGGTPGLAAVRAVALRYDAADLRGCMATDYNCLFEAYCGRNLSRVDPAPECEQERSQVVTIEAGIPSGRGLMLTCTPDATHAFTVREQVRGRDTWLLADKEGSGCELQVADRVNGRVQAGTQVIFLSEAGSINGVGAVDDNGRTATLLRVGQPPPRNVEAIDYEEEAGFAEDGHNPRDGLVRIVAVTRGEEDFRDINGDKIFSEAAGDFQEPGMDLPEPFVDANDNGTWDDGEEFRDANNNGVWDDANGVWDASTEIWTSDTVLWVGDLFGCDPEDPITSWSPDCGDADLIPEARQLAPFSVTCGQGCSRNPDFNPLCPASSFYVEPGGSIEVTGNLFDINGNCMVGEFDVRAQGPMASAGNVRGKLDCFQSFERPIGKPVVVELFDVAPIEAMGATITTVELEAKFRAIDDAEQVVLYSVSVCR